MFKHLLLPTDGTILSERAVRTGIELAHSLGARITALHVIAPFQMLTYQTEMLEETRAVYERDSLAHARRYLDFVAKAAAEHAVACETLTETRDDTYQVIIEIAQGRACDLIVMASHGRRGIAGLLMGSQTQHVLTHASVPVLVCR
jgi:nucleotide-binding universal stress UspA family protein